MEKLIEQLAAQSQTNLVTDISLRHLIKGSPDSRYGLVKRAIAKGELIHLRRGLYLVSKKFQRKSSNLFEIAQRIYGPSYISFESALSYHGWIPEGVYTVTSACLKRSKEFKTTLGVFSFIHIPCKNAFEGVERIDAEDGIFLVASPWKALADYVYYHKKNWETIRPLIEDLRIEKSMLRIDDRNLLDQLQENYQNRRVQTFLDGVKKEML